MKILDPGHHYELDSLDGEFKQTIRFVKRFDPQNPGRFPGNKDAYPGATLQMVIRVLINRVDFLQNQIWCAENFLIVKFLAAALWLLEFRAARRHGFGYWRGLKYAAQAPMCPKCGHTVCEHNQ